MIITFRPLPLRFNPEWYDRLQVETVLAVCRDVIRLKMAVDELLRESRLNRQLSDLAKSLLAKDPDIKATGRLVLTYACKTTLSPQGYLSEIDSETGCLVGHIFEGVSENSGGS